MEDDVLPELYDVLANILNALDFEQVADLASRKRYNALQNVAKSRFGASIICKLLDRGQVSLSQLSIQVKSFSAHFCRLYFKIRNFRLMHVKRG